MTDIYTKTPEEKLAQATSMFGKNPAAVQAGIAQNMTNSPTFQDTLSSQQNSVNAMQELANYDKQLAQQYQTGAQQAITNLQAKNQELSNYASGGADPNIIINKASQPAPAIDYTTNGFLSPFVASKLATGQQQANFDVFNMAANTRKSLETAIGTEAKAYADALKYLLDQEQQQAEKERQDRLDEEARVQREFENALNMAKLTGQSSIVDPRTGQKLDIRSAESDKLTQEKDKLTSDTWDKIVANSKNEYDIWRQIDANQDSLRNSGVDVDKLWAWHKNLVDRGGQLPNVLSDLSEKEKQNLLNQRGELVKQGLDTSEIDAKLGLKKAPKVLTDDAALAVSIIDDILATSPDVTNRLTGTARFGANRLYPPNWFDRSGIVAAEKMKQLSNLIQLAKAGSIKGQGQVSNLERDILRLAATSLALDDQGTSELPEQEFRNQLAKIKRALKGELIQEDISGIQNRGTQNVGVGNSGVPMQVGRFIVE